MFEGVLIGIGIAFVIIALMIIGAIAKRVKRG